MKTGELSVGMPREEYDRLRRVHWSKLKLMAKSPAHYRHALLEKEEDTDAKLLGRVTHLAIFEPERFLSDVVVWEDRRAGKAWERFEAEHKAAGREVITQKQYDCARSVATAVRADKIAAPFVSGGISELTVLWTHVVPPLGGDPGYSIDMKSRLDFVADVGALVDVKTCDDASPEGFGKTAWGYRYDAQAALYQDAYFAATGRLLPYVIVAVEKSAPHVVNVAHVAKEQLARGRRDYRSYLDRLALCQRTNSWPGYGTEPGVLQLPPWATRDDEEDLGGLGLDFTQEVSNG